MKIIKHFVFCVIPTGFLVAIGRALAHRERAEELAGNDSRAWVFMIASIMTLWVAIIFYNALEKISKD